MVQENFPETSTALNAYEMLTAEAVSTRACHAPDVACQSLRVLDRLPLEFVDSAIVLSVATADVSVPEAASVSVAVAAIVRFGESAADAASVSAAVAAIVRSGLSVAEAGSVSDGVNA